MPFSQWRLGRIYGKERLVKMGLRGSKSGQKSKGFQASQIYSKILY
jgi:hypothetical protein